MWVKDPKGGAKSVSLTLLIISFIIMVVAVVGEMTGKVQTTSIAPELFYACCATYFGRRMKIGNKEIQ
jgi:hypothetical protein